MPRFVLNHSKYKAVKTEYKGRKYDSKREAAYAAELDMLKNARTGDKRVEEWTPQVRIPLIVRADSKPGKPVLVCHYVVDFAVTYGDGHMEYHEVKGFETEVWKLKEKLFRALYPDAVLKVVK